MSILNVNTIQPVGSGQTITVSATNISAPSTVVTASNFVGNVSITGGTLSGISTIGVTTAYVTSINDGPLAGFRNVIINGGMDVWQRGTSFTSPANGSFTADRWKNSGPQTTITRSTDVPSGQPFTYSLAMGANGAGGGTRHSLLHAVELPAVGVAGPFKVGTTWTFSCWLKGGASGSIPFETNFRVDPNSSTDAVTISSTTFNYTTSWQRFTHTFTIGSSPAGTNLCLAAIFFASTAPANTLNITGCQLEQGTVATPFEQRPIGMELALCQRYYQTFPGSSWWFTRSATGTVYTSAIMDGSTITLPVAMRSTPTGQNIDGTSTLTGVMYNTNYSGTGNKEFRISLNYASSSGLVFANILYSAADNGSVQLPTTDLLGVITDVSAFTAEL